MEHRPVSEMKTEELLPEHVAIDAAIADLRKRQGELHAELTQREQQAYREEVSKRGPDFPPAQHIGGPR